jgi:ribonuclease P protein component
VQRIETHAQFQLILAASTVARTEHFVMHAASLQEMQGCNLSSTNIPTEAAQSKPQIWLGALVPKRWAKRAVTRNTIKRQIYSVAQELEANLPKLAHVIRLRKGFSLTQFKSASSSPLKKAVRLELQNLLNSLRSTATAPTP